MRRLFRAIPLLLALAAATGAIAAEQKQSHDVDAGITSVALNGRVHARVVLPADYADSHRRYPVVYFLHGPRRMRRLTTATAG